MSFQQKSLDKSQHEQPSHVLSISDSGKENSELLECSEINVLDSRLGSMTLGNDEDDTINTSSDNRTCPVCQESLVHPIILPCRHQFCYLCLKGVFARNGACAMCRRRIPPNLVVHPSSMDDEQFQYVHWMYEAKDGGWWLYEKRLSEEIEQAFWKKESKLTIQISGFLYVVDFDRMLQYRSEKPDRRRNIKRELSGNKLYKGIAGILVNRTDVQNQESS